VDRFLSINYWPWTQIPIRPLTWDWLHSTPALHLHTHIKDISIITSLRSLDLPWWSFLSVYSWFLFIWFWSWTVYPFLRLLSAWPDLDCSWTLIIAACPELCLLSGLPLMSHLHCSVCPVWPCLYGLPNKAANGFCWVKWIITVISTHTQGLHSVWLCYCCKHAALKLIGFMHSCTTSWT